MVRVYHAAFPRLYVDVVGTDLFLMCVHGDGKVETVARLSTDDEALDNLDPSVFA